MATPSIEIVPYDDRWPDDFDRLGSVLRESLGELALRIDHIGSTSVPDLAAKDRIDIQVTVAELDGELLRPRIEEAGFDWIHDIREDHAPPLLDLDRADLAKFIATSRPGHRAANCHIRQVSRYNQRYPLLNRDYLRAVPEAARTYEQIKVALALIVPNDAGSYYAVKDPVFDLIIQAAELWAQAAGWRPGGSDI